MANAKNFYITTPIFYVNDAPHIGHAYTEVAADVLARWYRQNGFDTWLLTGTDEHGQKILRTANSNSISPEEWVDNLVKNSWLPLLEQINISNDDFIRTTEKRHEENVKVFLQELYDRGYIYDGEFEALYCVGCEEFKPDNEIVLGTGNYAAQKLCIIHSKPLELLKEKNYFFKMSAFQNKLIELYNQNPNFIQPASARNEVLAFVQQGLKDLSISRSSFDWGIPIPWDKTHVTYVWFDALLNYITAIGYGENDSNLKRFWPAVHIVGKDILRFHAVIWPAMLMAAGLDVPKTIYAHGWLLVGGEKMSKSKLTGISPNEITDVFGSDAFRYYFMRAISFGNDGSFSWEDLSSKYQADLANGLGNLVSRTFAMIDKYFEGKVPDYYENFVDLKIIDLFNNLKKSAIESMDNFQIHEAVSSIWQLVDVLNLYITEKEPWKLAKDDNNKEELSTVMNTIVQGIRVLSLMLNPFMPISCQKIWSALQGEKLWGDINKQKIFDLEFIDSRVAGINITKIESLFPRIES